jgi:excisionase family DNA binding protein
MAKLLISTNEVFTIPEAAKLLKVTPMTIFRWIKSGKINPVKLSNRTLIPKSEIKRARKSVKGLR